MLLTTANLVHYLIARGTIRPEDVVDGPLRIVDFGRRNRNFKVFLGDAKGLFVKQSPGPVESAGGGLSREVACHRLARSRPEYAPLLDLMPRSRDDDPDRRALTVELVHPGEDLRERHDRLGPLAESLAGSLGRALGRLHALGPILAARPDDLAAFPRSRPWILDAIGDAEALYREMNLAQGELLTALIQSPELSYGLDGLRKAWRPATLIHGDLKRDNIMVLADDDGEGADPRFIDWELADVGDPAWDVAGLFQTWLEPGLIRAQGEDPSQDLLAVEPALPLIIAWWREYITTLGLPPDREPAHRVRCVHYLAAKLVLYAVELLGIRAEVTPTTRRIVRLARSIMVEPVRFADILLGSGRPAVPVR